MSAAQWQRGDGALELGFKNVDGVTRLAHLFQHDPCRALFPRAEPDDIAQAILITTSGGLAGGDRLRIEIGAGAETRQLLATQAAEKVYRSDGTRTEVDIALRVGTGTWIEWLPQETILFEGARLQRRVELDVAAGGSLMAGDILAFGRAARGERFTEGLLLDRWRLRIGGKLAWADQLRLDDPAADLAHPAGFDGAGAFATLIYVGAHAEALLPKLRELLEGFDLKAGCSLVGGALLVRMLAPGAEPIRRDFARAWMLIRSEAGGWPARMPRIWHT